MTNRFVSLLTLTLAAQLAFGCAVGPDFQKPAAPQVKAYTPDPLTTTESTPNTIGGQAQQFSEGDDIPAQWWTLFHSPELDALIKRSLERNPSLKTAQAALAVAREGTLAQEGAYYPTVAAGMAASRQKTSAEISPVPNSGAQYFNLYTPQVNVSYVPDVFGLNKRTVESLNAQAEQARYALIASQITLTSNVVAAAIQEVSRLRSQQRTHRVTMFHEEHLIECGGEGIRRFARRGGEGIHDRRCRRGELRMESRLCDFRAECCTMKVGEACGLQGTVRQLLR